MAKKSDLENILAFHCEAAGLPPFERDHKGWDKLKGTKREIDLAWPRFRVGAEVQGGLWMPSTSRGRGRGHAHPKRIRQDYEKIVHLQLLGWIILPLAPAHIGSILEGGPAVMWIEEALKLKGWGSRGFADPSQ